VPDGPESDILPIASHPLMRNEVAMNAKLSFHMGSIGHKDEHFSPIAGRISEALIAGFDALLDYLERRREIANLTYMDDRSLKDIGLTRSGLAGRHVKFGD
jgi:uncharacterized protein YjiS (DUF1127 family)